MLAFAFEAFGRAIGNADTFDALRLRGGFVFGGVECGVGRHQTRCAPQQCLMRFNGCNQQVRIIRLGLFVSNSATEVLIGPIAIDAAQTPHVSPYAFAMTVTIACCAAYVTPVSSPVNMLVMEPGGYAFGDYVKIGLPLLLLTLLVTVALVAVIYPL
jgi:hypothetical protein